MAELFHKEETPQHVYVAPKLTSFNLALPQALNVARDCLFLYRCWDRKYYNTFQDQLKVLKTSKTVYVGNLSFFTTEQQIHEAFSVVGPIKRIIMGVNAHTKTPCGFCFVEYYSRYVLSALSTPHHWGCLSPHVRQLPPRCQGASGGVLEVRVGDGLRRPHHPLRHGRRLPPGAAVRPRPVRRADA